MANKIASLLAQKDKLLKEEAQLKAQLRDLNARQKMIEQKDEHRRKNLVGACVLDAIEKREIDELKIRSLLDNFLNKVSDRALFNLKKTREN